MLFKCVCLSAIYHVSLLLGLVLHANIFYPHLCYQYSLFAFFSFFISHLKLCHFSSMYRFYYVNAYLNFSYFIIYFLNFFFVSVVGCEFFSAILLLSVCSLLRHSLNSKVLIVYL